ncbi:MAG: ribosomal protein S18-alanine N-acetyltransferase [bacterium]
MKREDMPAVLRIEQASFADPWTVGMFLRDIRDNRLAHFLVAKHKGKIIGYAGLWLIGDEAHLVNLAVDLPYRKQGIGRELLMAMLKIARDKGAQKATLEVRASNLKAQEFYQHFGFRPIAIRKGYYTHPKDDAVIMWQDDLTNCGHCWST